MQKKSLNITSSYKYIPEYEYKKHQQHAKCGHIVHSLHQHHQLPPKCRKEPDQLQNPQQAKGAQHRQPSLGLNHNLPHTETHTTRRL